MKKGLVLLAFTIFAGSCSDEPKDLTGRSSRGGDTVEITDASAQNSQRSGEGAHAVQKKGITFEAYPAGLYTGKIAAPDFASNPGKRMYRTVISKSMKKGVNFAGKYVVAMWGCGTGCQESAIIDAETGKIFNGISTENGMKFQANSRLLIANPVDSAAAAVAAGASLPKQQFYLWENENLRTLNE